MTPRRVAAKYIQENPAGYGAFDVAVSPTSGKVFVTGTGPTTPSGGSRFVTIAYDAANGRRLWEAFFEPRYGGTSYRVAVNPSGTLVYVSGAAGITDGISTDIVTVAYDSQSGTQAGIATYDALSQSTPSGLAVSPDGSRVFVTGSAEADVITLAYDENLDVQLWEARSITGTNSSGLAVSPDGKTVVVTGDNHVGAASTWGTVAYEASSGTEVWRALYGKDGGIAYDLAFSPDGRAVFVTGNSTGPVGEDVMATVSYEATQGTQLWAHRFNGSENQRDYGVALAVSPGGDRLFVTGITEPLFEAFDYVTLAYSRR
jgi:DNA-binding beta-propeller fold protein YncE